jgi:T-complex protein 1 subunit delta
MFSVKGLEAIIFREYAEALEIIPFTLAENAGMNPINVVT